MFLCEVLLESHGHWASFFIANSSSHSELSGSSSWLCYNGTTKSPSQAPTASPITLDPTKASNVMIPCGMNQRGSSFSCIFWLLSVALFVLSHYVSILLHNNEQLTSGTNIFSYHKWSDGCEYLNCLMRCRWSISLASQLTCLHVCEGHLSFHVSCLVHIYASFFIASWSSHSSPSACSSRLCYNGSATMALLQWRNHQSPSRSPSQAPTASPITPDPTTVSNVTSELLQMLIFLQILTTLCLILYHCCLCRALALLRPR